MIFFCKLISVGVGGMEGWEGHPAPKKLSQGTSFLGGEDGVGEGLGGMASLGIFGSLRMTFPGGNGKILRMVILLEFCPCCLSLHVKDVILAIHA